MRRVGLLKSRQNNIHFQLSLARMFPDILPKKEGYRK